MLYSRDPGPSRLSRRVRLTSVIGPKALSPCVKAHPMAKNLRKGIAVRNYHTEFSRLNGWYIIDAAGGETDWTGMPSGPQKLDEDMLGGICERLLDIPAKGVTAAAALCLQPVATPPDNEPWNREVAGDPAVGKRGDHAILPSCRSRVVQ